MNEYITKFNEFVEDIKEQESKINKNLQLYDMQRADLLHVLEFEKLDAVATAKVMKKLKEVSVKRREIKEQQREIQIVSCKIQKQTIKNITPLKSDPKKYNTNIIKEFI
jgi:hypothetical protein